MVLILHIIKGPLKFVLSRIFDLTIMRLLCVFLPLLTIIAHGKLMTEERHEKSLECASQLVQSARKEIREAGSQTQGVNPTVGIGEAILIFGIVGAIALLIALGFRQVRSKSGAQLRHY